jgi:hypothetical protein
MVDNDGSVHLSPSELTLESMRRAAEAATLATCETDSDMESSLSSLTDVIAQAVESKRLLEAINQAAGRSSKSMESLRIAVEDFTRAHKKEGATPEAVLITLKALVNQRSLPLLPRYMADWSGDRLNSTISTWCIQAYFRS